MRDFKCGIWLVAMTVALPGCHLAFTNANLGWQETGREVTIDPVNGDITRTFHWRYDDGYTTTTTDVIRRGEDNEHRRGTRPTPPARAEP